MMGRDNGVIKAWEATVRKTHAVAKKRANSIFGGHTNSNSSHENADEEFLNMEENGYEVQYETYQVEKDLPNGDYYNGECTDNFTHGMGKYLWADGCMYVGEWCKGKPMRRGMFSWPSGATYEGQFTNGYIHGTGTYTASNGDTYKGKWVVNLKHGYGVKSFANGDCYEGEWRRGCPNGQGRYQWQNGSHYIGEWKNGSMWGEGSFVWANGNRYDGLWEDGLPKGSGSYKWFDGSVYVGNWSNDPKDQHGAYYPSESTKEGHFDWDPQSLYYELNQHKICLGEKLLVLPSQKKPAVWKSTKADRTAVDTRAGEKGSNVGEEVGGDANSAAGNDLLEDDTIEDGEVQLQVLKVPRATKRPGETISPGHKSYDLMLNLQLGIRYHKILCFNKLSLDLFSVCNDLSLFMYCFLICQRKPLLVYANHLRA